MTSKQTLSVIALMCLTFAFSTADTVDWQDCGTTLDITDLRITGCTKQPCIFYQGREYKLEFDAVAKSSSKTLPYTVKAKILVPWTILRGDACEDLANGSCPILVGGQPFTFHKDFSADLPFFAPSKIPTTITAEMKDDDDDVLLCAKLAVEIRSADLDPNPLPPTTAPPTTKPSFAKKFFSFFGA